MAYDEADERWRLEAGEIGVDELQALAAIRIKAVVGPSRATERA